MSRNHKFINKELSEEDIEKKEKAKKRKASRNICQIFKDLGYKGEIFMWWHARTYDVSTNGHVLEGEIQCDKKRLNFHFEETYVMNYKRVKK